MGRYGKVWWVFHCGLWIIYLYYQVCLLSTLQQNRNTVSKSHCFQVGIQLGDRAYRTQARLWIPRTAGVTTLWHFKVSEFPGHPDTAAAGRTYLHHEYPCQVGSECSSKISYLSTQTSWQTPINRRTPVHLWWSRTSWFDRNSVRLT